jgi:tetratricopeptide (TPR) repeat protein
VVVPVTETVVSVPQTMVEETAKIDASGTESADAAVTDAPAPVAEPPEVAGAEALPAAEIKPVVEPEPAAAPAPVMESPAMAPEPLTDATGLIVAGELAKAEAGLPHSDTAPLVETASEVDVIHGQPEPDQAITVAPIISPLADSQQAIDRYRSQLEEKPKDEESRLALARAYRDQEQMKLALEQYGVLLRGKPKLLAQLVEDMESLVASRPDNLEAHELLADMYGRSGQLQKAAERYRWILQRLEQRSN